METFWRRRESLPESQTVATSWTFPARALMVYGLPRPWTFKKLFGLWLQPSALDLISPPKTDFVAFLAMPRALSGYIGISLIFRLSPLGAQGGKRPIGEGRDCSSHEADLSSPVFATIRVTTVPISEAQAAITATMIGVRILFCSPIDHLKRRMGDGVIGHRTANPSTINGPPRDFSKDYPPDSRRREAPVNGGHSGIPSRESHDKLSAT